MGAAFIERRKKRGIFGTIVKWLFIAFNIFMLIALINGFSAATHDYNHLSDAGKAGAAIGTTVGVTLVLVLWGMGDLILGIIVLLTRGEKILLQVDQVPETNNS
jgi:hypothetical protein